MKGIISNSCNDKLTANVFLGKAGVGKSTVASWLSSVPGLFEVGTVSGGTTTLGTWLSSSVQENYHCEFAYDTFNPDFDIENLTPLPDMKFCLNSTGHIAFFDTEGSELQIH